MRRKCLGDRALAASVSGLIGKDPRESGAKKFGLVTLRTESRFPGRTAGGGCPTFVSRLHAIVVWPAATFRWNPSNDLIRVGDVAGFAVDAVRRVQADALA